MPENSYQKIYEVLSKRGGRYPGKDIPEFYELVEYAQKMGFCGCLECGAEHNVYVALKILLDVVALFQR